jgi:hypothetical protein
MAQKPKAGIIIEMRLEDIVTNAIQALPAKMDELRATLQHLIDVVASGGSAEVAELRRRLAIAEAEALTATTGLKESTGELRQAIDEAAAKGNQP